jgi:hypothetical protein
MTHNDPVFSATYAEARDRFRAVAAGAGLPLQAHRCPVTGIDDEALSMDVARLGDPNAEAVLLLTSGCHGIEGYCGSGVQVALLQDAHFLETATRAGVAVAFVHALNPWGFSHGRRVTQEGVDLNRNFVDFGRPLPHNRGYDEIAHALVPDAWPPDGAAEGTLARYEQAHGAAKLREAVNGGQYHHPEGLFYGGTAATWSHRTVRLVLWQQASRARRLAWIDVHTGLGPRGVGERIWAGRDDDVAVHRAKAWWGPAVTTLFDGSASSPALDGTMWHAAYDECPQAEFTAIALEFGTLPVDAMIRALRGDHWAAAHPDAPPALRAALRATMREAFFVDTPEWKAAVLAQAREAATQAVEGLAGRPVSHRL